MVNFYSYKDGSALGYRFIQLGILMILSLHIVCDASDVYGTSHGLVRVSKDYFFVNTGNVIRVHDFGPTGGFVDPASGAPSLAVIIAAGPTTGNTILSGASITNSGLPGRAEWTPSAVIMANYPNEGTTGEPCRAQATSYPVSPDKALVWSLRVQLGDKKEGLKWALLPTGIDPALLWQLKAPSLQPSLAMIVDTDDMDASKLMLYFSQLGGTSKKIQRAGTMHGLLPGTPIDVRIEARLDEREINAGGQGSWHVWVNGRLVVDHAGPTLGSSAKEPHQWFFGLYRYLTTCPSNVPRITRWEKLLLEQGL